MNNMILKPDSMTEGQGWEKINLSGKITTNIISRKYDYLLSLLSLGSATQVAKNGVFYLVIGDVDTDAECEEKETVIRITENGIAIIGKCE